MGHARIKKAGLLAGAAALVLASALTGFAQTAPSAPEAVPLPERAARQTLSPDGHTPSYELPAVTVAGQAPAELKEEERVGSYGQPRWTATRRFTTTRVYVVPEGKVEVEYWNRSTFNDGDTEMRQLAELEIGLPYRFQIDIYFRTDSDGFDGNYQFGGQFEVRWALADWGKIWGNPTIYLEYVLLDDGRPDVFEPKLLFGGEIAPRWHWAANLVGEFELDGPDYTREYQLDGGVSYTVVDSKFSVGLEGQAIYADVDGDRGVFSKEYFVGPNVQWKPIEPLTINFLAMAGVGRESPDARLFLNVGWEF